MNLETLGYDDFFRTAFSERASVHADGQPARVAADLGPFYRLWCADGELLAEPSGRLRHEATGRAELPVVGDFVVLRRAAGAERGQVVEVLPRRTRLSRQAAGDHTVEQVLAANLDTVFLVTGLDRDFNPRRLQRALLLVRHSGAAPVIVLNKSDRSSTLVAQRAAVAALAHDTPVVVTAAKLGEGLQGLDPYLIAGRTVALLGSSGVGKSTIINRLLGEDKQPTQDVRVSDSRGRHTTTHRELVLLPQGALLIDTPGMRELQLWAGEQALEQTFDDIDTLAPQCGFRDCTHVSEPRCAVQKAVADGRLPADRLAHFHKLRAELRHLDLRDNLPAQAAQRRQWRSIHKAARHHRPRR